MSATANMPTCKLCDNDRKLIDAHIIPRAFWRLPPAGEDAAKIISNSKGVHPRRMLEGVYDSSILCGECDGELGKLDQHAAESLLHAKPASIMGFRQLMGRRYEEADAARLRLFIASVAWRASISSQIFFARVSLGPYEELIRQALRQGINNSRVECVLGEFDNEDIPLLDPHWTRFDGVRFWLIYANRFIFYVKVDQRPMPGDLAIHNLHVGQPVHSFVRSWEDSKERSLMQSIATANPNAFRRRRR